MPETDSPTVQPRARAVSHLLGSHGGGIKVIESKRAGVVRVRFTGLCAACWMRPITMTKIVEPALRDLDGVTAVEAEGVRYSTHAQKRLSEPEQ
jgi:Fe-S cluster biogenesis protein NfuA